MLCYRDIPLPIEDDGYADLVTIVSFVLLECNGRNPDFRCNRLQ